MEEIKIFNSPQFGEIRTAGTSEQPLFCLADLCAAIGLKDVSRCASRLDDDMRQTHPILDRLGREQQAIFVSEAGMYDVIIRSDSDKAKPFRRWITSEVLPSIRKTGGYAVGKPLSPIEMQLEMMKSMQLQLQELISTKEEVKQLKSELADVRQRTATEIEASTIVAYVTRNHIKLDVTKYGAMGRKATSLCKKRGIEVTKINDVRWGTVSVYPDSVLEEVFNVIK